MTKTLINTATNEKVHVTYYADPQSLVYRILDVYEGGESWDEAKVFEHRNKIVDAIHGGYSAL